MLRDHGRVLCDGRTIFPAMGAGSDAPVDDADNTTPRFGGNLDRHVGLGYRCPAVLWYGLAISGACSIAVGDTRSPAGRDWGPDSGISLPVLHCALCEQMWGSAHWCAQLELFLSRCAHAVLEADLWPLGCLWLLGFHLHGRSSVLICMGDMFSSIKF